MLEQMQENLRYYCDTAAFACNMLLGWDIAKIEIVDRSHIADGI